jgi:drug/metabolite transporter (DMT)-like permease
VSSPAWASPAAVPRHALGVGLIVLMGALFAVLDTSAKYLGQVLPVLLVLWVRYAVQAALMGVWLGWRGLRGGGNLFVTMHPRFQALRGSLLLTCSALVFFGLQWMPVAEFTALSMLTPVIATVLAALLLHEHLSPLRAALVVGGFAGALLVVRPGSGLFGWAAVLPLCMALVYAVFQLLTRKLAGLEHPLTTHFYTGLVGTLITTPLLLLSPVEMLTALQAAGPALWGLLLLAGVLGTAGHLCLILALGMAPMAVLMPFTYLQIAFASLGGWVVFRHVPDAWAFAGMAVVAGCGAVSVWLNQRDGAANRPAPADSAPMPD